METRYFRKGFGLKSEVQPLIDSEYHSALVQSIRGSGHRMVLGDMTVRLAKEFGFCYGVDRAIDYAYETGRLAAELVAEAVHSDDGRLLQQYLTRLDEEYGLYFKVARLFAKVIGNPALTRELTRVGMRSQSLMEWALRIMANLLRPDEVGPAEAAYAAIARIVRLVPD